VLRAIIAAKARADAIHGGADARPARTRTIEDGNKPAGETIGSLLDEFVVRYVEKDAKLRSADTIKSAFDRLVKPEIGNVGIYDLRRSALVRLLDKIADKQGPVMADHTLAFLSKAFSWRAARDDDFMSPVVKGMRRTKAAERARNRVLADDEVRDIWSALDGVPHPACYARFVRFLLHTASRRNEAAFMRWDEIDGDVWTIPGARYKTKRDHVVPLTAAALKLIGDKPADTTKYPFVFSSTGGEKAFRSEGRAKRALENKITELRKVSNRQAMPQWQLHDLRRTARSLMSRAGVPPDHAERAIGHTIGGVGGIYDRHEYLEEKREAFEALDALLERILKPVNNVTELGKRRKTRA
jgi:integrase